VRLFHEQLLTRSFVMIQQSESSRPGRSGIQALITKCAAVVSAAVLAVAALAPATVQAASSPITQLEYIQWLVQLAGDTGQFSDSSTGGDYVNWARGKGLNPKNGWNVNGKLSKSVLGETLGQLLNFNNGQMKNYIRELTKLGIILPDSEDVSRKDVVSLVDNGLQPRLGLFRTTSPGGKGNNGLGNGEDPPPPGWVRNHPGRPQNDGPGSSPGHPANGHKGP